MKLKLTIFLPFLFAASIMAEPSVPLRDATRVDASFSSVGIIENADYRIEFFHASWDGGDAYVHDLYRRDGEDWVLLNTPTQRFDSQWIVFRGDDLNRDNYYSAADKHWVNFTAFNRIDEQNAELGALGGAEFDLRLKFSLNGRNPNIHLTLTPKASAHYVVGHQAFAPESVADLNEVLCGPVLHAKVTGSVKSYGALRMSAPISMYEKNIGSNVYSFGVFVPSREIVFEHEQNKGVNAQRYGMSLKNNDDNIQPCIYIPQFGKHSSMTAEEDYNFTVGIYAGKKPLFDAYKEICQNEYGYRDYRRNIFDTNLTDTMHNIIDLLKAGPEKDDSVEFQPSASGWWSRAKGYVDIENDKCVRTVTASGLLSAYLLTGDDELYDTRALPMLEYNVSRNGYGWTPIKGKKVYGDASKYKMCSVPFDVATLAPMYNLTRGRNAGVYRLGLSRLRAGSDFWLKRTPINGPLAGYSLTGDQRYLDEAKSEGVKYIAANIDTPYTGGYTEHDFQYYYSRAWTECLELYEATGDEVYLDAAYREAKRFVTQHFVRPIPEGSISYPQEARYHVHDWWKPSILDWYPRSEFEEETAEKWLASRNGMTFEQMSTYLNPIGGHTMNPAWAPFLLRLAHYKDDAFLRDIANNLVVGRYTNYPGYYNRMFAVQHMRPDYPYQGPSSGSMIYYHHIPVQLGMTMDFLITESITRSNGKINFPSEFEAAYVWFKYRLFGHKPGSFYDTPDAWLWMPKGIIATDNYLVNWITAESGDKFHISLTNSSQSNQTVTVSLNEEIVGFDTSASYDLTIIADNGQPQSATMRNGRFTVDVSPKGITAVTVAGMDIDIALHDYSPDERDASDASYWFDNASFGQVRGMLLVKPDKSSYNAYVQTDVHSDVEPSATLYYSTNGGESYTALHDDIYPFEWSIVIDDLSKSFTYYVKVASGAASAPTHLWLPNEYDGPQLQKPGGKNHALGKPVRVDSTYSCDYPGSNAVNGCIFANESRWLSADTTDDHWIEVDLTEEVTVNTVRFWTGYDGFNTPIPNYRLQYWDGSAWVDIVSRTGNTAAVVTEVFPEVRTRKVRLLNSPGVLVKLYEIQIVYDDEASTSVLD